MFIIWDQSYGIPDCLVLDHIGAVQTEIIDLKNMDKTYDHKQHEEKIYAQWEKSGAFSPDFTKASSGKPNNDPKAKTLRAGDSPSRRPYTIIMPPPNANDPLHIGHAMFVTVEDILIRYHRMKGEAALWLPGTDHAGIETQFVFEKKLKKEGNSRFDFDRQTLYRMIWDYVQENSGMAVTQMKKLGASADWSRFKFTLDQDIVSLVIATFIKLHQDGLVYRDLKLVNYCTHCGTAFSDLEVKHVERKDPLYYMKYGPFTLATVRPETKFGDTALAVNPKDKRYQKWIGQEVDAVGLLGQFKIKVIADEVVDPEFGTGVVKVTPFHDPNDWDIWQKHKSEMPLPKQVIDFTGKLNEHTGKYNGLKVKQARKIVAEDLAKNGLMDKVDANYTHTVGVCYRCGYDIEPLPLPQFFIKVAPLTKVALQALKEKRTLVYGAGHDKILVHWLKNLKDWNISRQIVWGIRLPVWYSITDNPDMEITFLDKNKTLLSDKLPKLLKDHTLEQIKAGLQSLKASINASFVISQNSPGDNFLQDTDTFDTWFSSAQWPFATLMTSDKKQVISNKQKNNIKQQIDSDLSPVTSHLSHNSDFEHFYPTSLLETGYDILPFWVMRMLFMGLYMTNEVPFEKVYLHGLVRDEKGHKMSKSKGNVINPLDIVDKYGADALRMALVMSTTAGKDSNTGETKIRGMRNFTNKIWNAARFIIMNLENSKSEALNSKQIQNSNFQNSKTDEEFYKKLNEVIKTVTKQLDDLKIGLAAETLYNEFWHWFCDISIEQTKRGELSMKALTEGLATFLKLLHPFVPFVTEAIWEKLPQKKSELLISSPWPKVKG